MSNYYKKNQQPGLIETIFTTIGRGLWFVISWPFIKIFNLKTKSEKLDKIANLNKWNEIEKLLESNDEIHAKHAVVEADIFLDTILRQLGAKGDKFADRLRDFENNFSKNNYQAVWEAHKLRNQISHEHEFKPTIEECSKMINKFRKGLENLGAL